MVILMVGPPGSGKGTQAYRLSRWLQVPAISTGEMLRAEVARRTQLGLEIAGRLAQGQFASDDMVNRMVLARLAEPDFGRGCLLDGYPRTVEQARFLDAALEKQGMRKPAVIHLDVPSEVIVSRLSSRRQCLSCGRIFNLLLTPEREAEMCHKCGTALVRRDDDEASVVLRRLAAYRELTRPVLAHYTGDRYFPIDGNRRPDEVFQDIRKVLEPSSQR